MDLLLDPPRVWEEGILIDTAIPHFGVVLDWLGSFSASGLAYNYPVVDRI